MNKQFALALVALTFAPLSAHISSFNDTFVSAVANCPTLETKIFHSPDDARRAPADDLCELYNSIHCCCTNLLAQTKEDVRESDPALAQYIATNETTINTRFAEMATSYAQDVTSAINTNVTAGAIAYLTYHNELTKYDNVIAIFYADWYNPYQLMRPALESLSEKYADKVQFMEINTNTMHIYGIDIKHIPTLIFYKKSAAVDIHVGLGIDEDMFQDIARSVTESNPTASQDELTHLIRTSVAQEIERVLDSIIQEHFVK